MDHYRKTGVVGGGGIYFDEEEAGEGSGVEKQTGDQEACEVGKVGGLREIWRKSEEWVHCRCVRTRSVRYLAGECPPQRGAGVLATYRRCSQERYYDADVVDVRVVSGDQQVLVQYVHGHPSTYIIMAF